MAPRKDYTPLQMSQAIQAVKNGSKVAAAAKQYGVPRITLHNKISGISPQVCTMGPGTYLTQNEENVLEKWILDMADKHIPVTKEELLDSVQKIIVDKKLETPFVANRPGKKWYSLFLKRHPSVTSRTAQNLTTNRDNVTEEDIHNWFKEVDQYLKNNNLTSVIDQPERVFNMDESAFFLAPKPGKVLAKKGHKHVYSSSGDEKDNLTVLITGNAAGQLAPPMVVYNYERIPAAISLKFPEEWGIGRSESGWMCGSTFFEYVTNIFEPWLTNQNIQRPVLLFLDGHASHLTLHLSNFCAEKGIEVIALYPNSTHILQPMDLSVFKPLKQFWKKAVNNWKIEHLGQVFKKEHFAPVFKTALGELTSDSIKNGFRCAGLCPFGPEYVDMTKIKSQSRKQTHEQNMDDKTKWLAKLENEIVRTFNFEKLTAFNEMFYKKRNILDECLPNEDTSLYVLWAVVKSEVGRSTNINDTNHELVIQEPIVVANIQEPTIQEPSIQGPTIQESYIQEPTIQESTIPIPTTQESSIQRPTIQESYIQEPTIQESTKPKPTTQESSIERPTIQESSIQEPSIQESTISIPTIQESSIQRPTIQESSIQEPTIQKSTISIPTIQESSIQRSSIQELTIQESTIQKPTIQEPPKQTTKTAPIIQASITPNVPKQIHMDEPEKSSNRLHVIQKSPQPSTSRQETYMRMQDKTPAKTIHGMYVPSPFKRNLFWPDEIESKKGRKRKLKEKIPCAITSSAWKQYHEKKESEKQIKLLEKQKRAHAREEKRQLKDIKHNNKLKKPRNKKRKTSVDIISSDETDAEIQYAESDDSYCSEKGSWMDETEEEVSRELKKKDISKQRTKSIDSEGDKLLGQKSTTKLSKGCYVIVKYEGEYFPGIVENIDNGYFEISTMTFSIGTTGNTFRWPEKKDTIWYKRENIIEIIDEPVLSNKRGFYTVREMIKYSRLTK